MDLEFQDSGYNINLCGSRELMDDSFVYHRWDQSYVQEGRPGDY